MEPTFISLESIQIASPCRADWNAMQKVQGHDCVRFCPSCGKNVYNLSAMTRDEAMRLIEQKEGSLCVRLRRRSDGTVLTTDCPIGSATRKRHRQGTRLLVGALGFITALFGWHGVLKANSPDVPEPEATQVTMGDPFMPPLETPSTHTQ